MACYLRLLGVFYQQGGQACCLYENKNNKNDFKGATKPIDNAGGVPFTHCGILDKSPKSYWK